jgi:O-Antigen ligase
MDAALKPQTSAERVIWYTIVLSYPMYFLGLVFPVNTTLPWILLINVGMRFWQQSDRTPLAERVRIPAIVGVWVVGMLTVLVALLVGLTDSNYDIREIIRSSLNWCREWALYPICLTLGSCLRIRPQIIYRAVCNLCAQSLVMITIGIVAFAAKLPDLIYNSPIERLTQNGKLFYEVRLYVIDLDSGGLRFTLFAPWAPALGLIACIYFLLVLQESHRGWKTIGIVGATAMILASLSRGSFIFLPAAMLLIWVWVSANRAYLQLVAGFLLFWATLFSFAVTQVFETAIDGFVGARKSSSQLREVIQRVSLDRFADAPIWGHGKQVAGPKVLKGMPLGSHHTWVGLLFSHGIVGFMAVLIPVVATLVILAIRAKADRLARVALAVMLVVLFTSMGESMEKLAYLFWPALVLVGMALRPAPTPQPRDR